VTGASGVIDITPQPCIARATSTNADNPLRLHALCEANMAVFSRLLLVKKRPGGHGGVGCLGEFEHSPPAQPHAALGD
jgi:hypothetical protein